MKIKPAPPPVAEAHCYVVRIYQRNTGQWFSTIAKDAIVLFTSRDVDTKLMAIEYAADNLPLI